MRSLANTWAGVSFANVQDDLSICASFAQVAANLTEAFSSNGKKGTSLVRPLLVGKTRGLGPAMQPVFVARIAKQA